MTKADQAVNRSRRKGARAAIAGGLGGRSSNGDPPASPSAGSSFVASFMDTRGLVDVDRVAKTFRMSKGQLAQTAGLGLASISKADRRSAPKAQSRVTEVLEIISRVRDWAGGEAQAMAWYRAQPIPGLDGRTPEALVKAGRASAVRDYLDHLAVGGFA